MAHIVLPCISLYDPKSGRARTVEPSPEGKPSTPVKEVNTWLFRPVLQGTGKSGSSSLLEESTSLSGFPSSHETRFGLKECSPTRGARYHVKVPTFLEGGKWDFEEGRDYGLWQSTIVKPFILVKIK